MIIGALANYYELLLDKEEVSKDGWSRAKVSYAITIDENGKVRGIIPLGDESEIQEKKRKSAIVVRTVPLQSGRSRQIAPNFMCDNAKYLLGVWIPSDKPEEDEKYKKQAQEYFKASAEHHKKFLSSSRCKDAESICRFFDTWDYESGKDSLNVDWEKIAAASNLVFRSYETTKEMLENPEIQEIWNRRQGDKEEQKLGRCLVTGKQAPIARLHPLLKGVRGAQSSGAALISFNGDAFESYGKEQGDNAPVSEYVADAYGKALNYLLSEEKHHRVLGDTTVVFWAEVRHNESSYASFMSSLFGNMEESDEKKLLKTMDSIANGIRCEYEETELLPETPFYILGLAPNAARISVRFFYEGTFGKLIANISKHYERLAIESPSFEKKEYPSISEILYETVNKKSTVKQAQPILVGALMKAVLENTRYPTALYTHLMLRIHAEHFINRNRAAIIKAYLLQNYPNKKEAIDTMKLNEETDEVAYVLGRLFAVLEDIQESAIGKETLKDRYFNAASSTPAVVFPQMMKLAQSHLRVLGREKKGLQVAKEKELTELFGKIDSHFPARLSLEDQGVFMIGYYHQIQKKYTKKDKQED